MMNFSKRGGAVVMAACLLGMVITLYVRGQDTGKPELLIQAGHPFRVSSLDFNSDGKLLASGSWDSTVKLWDVKSGRVIRTLEGHGSFVYSVSFSPDNKTLASANRDKTIKLWHLDKLADPLTIKTAGEVNAVEFSPDGAILIGAGQDGVIRLWNARSGTVRGALPGHSHDVYSLAVSGDSQKLASASMQEIKLWDLKAGKESQSFAWCSNKINSVAFSPDNKTLAAGCFDGSVLLWNVETGEQQTLRMHESGEISVQFSPDGSLLGSRSHYGIKLYNLATGQTHALEGETSRIEVIRFSPDGKSLVGGGDEGDLKFWHLGTGKQERARFLRGEPGRFPLAETVAFSPDGKTLAAGLANGSIRTWGLKEGASSASRLAHTERVNSVVFTPDNKFLLSTSPDRTLKIWDMSAGGEPKVLPGYLYVLSSEAFSPDGKLLATDSDDGIRVWDLSAGVGRVVKKLSDDAYSTTFSPDGKRLAVSASNRVTLLDIETGREQVLHQDHGGVFSVVRFSPNGTKAIQGEVDHSISIRDVAGGGRPQSLQGGSDWASHFVFDRDGKYLASISGGEIKLWDLQAGRETAVGDPLPSWVKFDNLGRFPVGDVLALGDGNYIKLIKVVAGKGKDELVRIYGVGEDGWVTVAPDGRFDTNLPLEDLRDLGWLMPDDPLRTLPLEILMRDYYEPRLLSRLLAGEQIKPVRDLTELNRVQPEISISRITPQSADTVSVSVEVANATGSVRRNGKPIEFKSGAYDVRLFRDGQLVGYSPQTVGIAGQGEIKLDASGKATLTFNNIKLPRRADLKSVKFTAYAFNVDRVKSATAELNYDVPAGVPTVKGRAYVVSFGVNVNDDPRWNLKYAANDARLVEEALTPRLKQTGEYEEVVGVPLISDDVSKDGKTEQQRSAIKANIRTVLDLLAGHEVSAAARAALPNGEKIQKARPEDLVVISFASHGYTNQQGIFYLVPQDTGASGGSGVEGIKDRCISSEELSVWLRDVDAGEMVMIIDACHSAASVEGEGFKPGPMGSRGLGQLAYDKGMRILAATQAQSLAGESSAIGHGLLTYALVREGLEGAKADKNVDKRITFEEWLNFGVERVPSLYEDVRTGKMSATMRAELGKVAEAIGKRAQILQQPSLFDFARKRVEFVLSREK